MSHGATLSALDSRTDVPAPLARASGSPFFAWLQKADHEVESSADKIGTFLRLRYDEMGRLFPHDVFSVQEATPDFFAETVRYLTADIPDNRPGIKPEDAKHDIYWRRYRDWMIANT